MAENPDKYVENWNENNPTMLIPTRKRQDELRTKDEAWKEADWYKESQQVYATTEEGTGQG